MQRGHRTQCSGAERDARLGDGVLSLADSARAMLCRRARLKQSVPGAIIAPFQAGFCRCNHGAWTKARSFDFAWEVSMKIQKSLLLMVLSIVLAACASTGGGKSGATVRSDYDPSAKFAAYKSFGFVTPLGTDVDGYPAEITQGIKAAAQRELEARGYRHVDSHPDLLVNFSARLANKQKTDELTNQQIGYYGYRKVAVYKTWSTYTYDKGVDSYTEGTLNVDIVDARTDSLVWEGVAIGEVKEKAANLQPAINRVVAEIFAKYPFRAQP
jgi:hypothetical protein